MASLRHSVSALLLLAVLPSVSPAQDADSAARVLQLAGQVSVLKDSTPWALHVNSTVQVKQVIVTGPDGYAMLQVSDGSTFEVFPNSRVVFRANPANWKDLLDLYLGQVKVHIQRLGGQPNFNRIKTPTAVISVRGTVFDVKVEDETATLVQVHEGLVEVSDRVVGATKLVEQGQELWIYKDQPLARQASPVRGAVLKQVGRATYEAIIRVANRGPLGTPSGNGTPVPPVGGGGSGDTETTTPPPPPPPPAPPVN